MAAESQPRFYTVEEYLTLDRNASDARYEYYDGYIRLMSGGTTHHQILSANIIIALGRELADSPCVVLTSDCRVQVNAARYVYPDVTVTCDAEDIASDIIRMPVVIFEVLSPSTEAFDRGQKADYYRAMPSLMEYVLITQTAMSVQVQRRFNASNLWTIETHGEGDSITLTSLGVTISVTDIYRKIVFPATPIPDLPEAPIP
jgi:Uma2 family endonuclease